MLIAKIKLASFGNQQAMLELVEQFNPLLQKFATKLGYSDAYFDLRLMFIDMIYDLGKNKLQYINSNFLLGYIKKAVEHAYYRLLYKRHRSDKDIFFSEMSDEQLYTINAKLSYNDHHDTIFFSELKYVLTKREYDVIEKIFVLEKNITEIAGEYGVSRQSINQTKKRALHKIQQWLIDDNTI